MACKNICFTAVLDNMRLAMSKTSLDFGFFCDVNQKSEGSALSSRPLRKQKFTSTGSKSHGL